MPDIYQGAERWDFNLVDPDNRRPVDYKLRVEQESASAVSKLMEKWQDGSIKQYVISRILSHRAEQPDLYCYGSYEPLNVKDTYADKVVAYMRRYKDQILVVIIPVAVTKWIGDKGTWSSQPAANTHIDFPAGNYVNLVTGNIVTSGLSIQKYLNDMPAAVLAKITE